MRGRKQDRTACVVIRGHALIQNLQRRHYELGVDARPRLILAAAFDELALVVSAANLTRPGQPVPDNRSMRQCRPACARIPLGTVGHASPFVP